VLALLVVEAMLAFDQPLRCLLWEVASAV